MMAISTSITLALESSDTDQQYLWAVSNAYQQKKMIFSCSGSTEGNISSVEVTPHGRGISAYYSHIANIDQGKMKLHEKTSALQGSYMSEDSIKFESEIANLEDYYFYNPFLELHLESTITVSSWNANRSIRYSGKEINDRDYAFNDFDQYGKYTNLASFLYNTNFSKDRVFKSPGEFWIKKVETTGLSELEFHHGNRKESQLVTDEIYLGKFNISLDHKFGFGNMSTYYPCLEYYP